MSNSKFLRVKRDKSHIKIQNELRQRGFSVCDLSEIGRGCPDILIADANNTVLCELKESDGEIYIAQLEYIASWKGFVAFATTVDDCLAIMANPSDRCLKSDEKRCIDQIAVRYRAKTKDKIPRIAWTTFQKLMSEI